MRSLSITEVLDLGDEWRSVRDRILAFKEQSAALLAAQTSHDPTNYSSATKNAAT